MDLLERAIILATEAHGKTGQRERNGNPYILHPLRVMLSVKTHQEQVAAILHDVVEDTDVTPDDLRAAGFPDDVLAAVDALTKRPGETRMDAARRAAGNSIARAVKLADLRDNMNLTRIPSPTQKDRDRMQQYEQVRAFLASAGNAVSQTPSGSPAEP